MIFDARSVEPFRGVTHQACAVFAGTWPATPHPTLFPGGPGSHTPCYDTKADHTFYYLQLDLKDILDTRLRMFRFEKSCFWH